MPPFATTHCFVLVPGLSGQFRSGGLMVAHSLVRSFVSLGCDSRLVLTDEDSREHPQTVPLELALAQGGHSPATTLFIVTWGPLVEQHIRRIRQSLPQARILYYAQSYGWPVRVPAEIPIVSVSRYVMARWSLQAQGHLCTHIPPPLNPVFTLRQQPRDLDVLAHTRKQSAYCLNQLIPALQQAGLRLQIIDSWISQDELASLLNRAKIFLYLTDLPVSGNKTLPGEGFGLPPLEALACGALVGSNLRGGVTDYLNPWENCLHLQEGSLQFDTLQVIQAVQHFQVNASAARHIIERYSSTAMARKWANLLATLDQQPEIFSRRPAPPPPAPPAAPDAQEQQERDCAISELVELIPPGGAFILVDQAEWGMPPSLANRACLPFLESEGAYFGPPADDQAAIRELHRLRKAGARFMAFARPAFWWLDHYAGLHQHLRSHFHCALENERLVVFDLHAPSQPASPRS